MKRTKIVCTLGPASSTYVLVKELAKSGMDVARLNFSHGNHEQKQQLYNIIRKVSHDLDRPIAVMADMQGPKIRLGEVDGVRQITKGDTIILSLNPVDDELPMVFDLSPFVKKGQRIYLNDGLVSLSVKSTRGKSIITEAQNSGWVSAHKGVNIPDTRLKNSVFTSKDMEDAEFALKMGCDYLAVSFIQAADDLTAAKTLIKKYNPKVKLLVKIEKNEAVTNLEEIIQSCDAVMVARGDLGIEAKAAEVPLIQQKIIKICRQYHRPVIVATQMLESMIVNPRPTRAETSDVANAVLDQVDAVMLSAESASGSYPVEAVKTMADIIETVEHAMYSEHSELAHYTKINWQNIPRKELHFNAIASSAASLAYKMNAKLIAVGTTTGTTVLLIASFRPDASIVAITHDEQTRNQLALVWGTIPNIIPPTKHAEDFWHKIAEFIRAKKLAPKGEKIVLIGGSTLVGASGATDTIKVITI